MVTKEGGAPAVGRGRAPPKWLANTRAAGIAQRNAQKAGSLHPETRI
jgi:hypothetical protein